MLLWAKLLFLVTNCESPCQTVDPKNILYKVTVHMPSTSHCKRDLWNPHNKLALHKHKPVDILACLLPALYVCGDASCQFPNICHSLKDIVDCDVSNINTVWAIIGLQPYTCTLSLHKGVWWDPVHTLAQMGVWIIIGWPLYMNIQMQYDCVHTAS